MSHGHCLDALENDPVEIYNFLKGCRLPRKTFLGALALSKTKHTGCMENDSIWGERCFVLTENVSSGNKFWKVTQWVSFSNLNVQYISVPFREPLCRLRLGSRQVVDMASTWSWNQSRGFEKTNMYRWSKFDSLGCNFAFTDVCFSKGQT